MNIEAFIYICLAGVFVQSVHSYLLFSQRSQRKWSISDHATINIKSLLLYFMGHFLGGAFWLAGTNLIFSSNQNRFIFHIALVTVALQWLQAAVPSKPNKSLSLHSVLAYSMWIGCMVTVILGTIYANIPVIPYLFAIICCVAILTLFVYMHIDRSRVYRYQYSTIYFFFVGMAALAF